jgi:hypothetical protein
MGAKRYVSAPARNWTSTSSTQLVSLMTWPGYSLHTNDNYIHPSAVHCSFNVEMVSTFQLITTSRPTEKCPYLKGYISQKNKLTAAILAAWETSRHTKFVYSSSSSTVSTLYGLMDEKSIYCLSHPILYLVIINQRDILKPQQRFTRLWWPFQTTCRIMASGSASTRMLKFTYSCRRELLWTRWMQFEIKFNTVACDYSLICQILYVHKNLICSNIFLIHLKSAGRFAL